MADEGSHEMLTELVLQEKELTAKIDGLSDRMKVPLERLAKAKAILLKAKGAFEAALADVKPLQSEKILLEGELEILREKKSKIRQEARLIEGGGIRPGTGELVRQMNELAGDPEQAAASKAARELEVEAALADLKRRSGQDE